MTASLPSSSGDLVVTRLVLETIVSVDLGWIAGDDSADLFLQHRGRPGWLGQVVPKFVGAGAGFRVPLLCKSAYETSGEHARPTFSAAFSRSYMPLAFEAMSPTVESVGCLNWSIRWIKVGPTGALSLRVTATLASHRSQTEVLEIVQAYQHLRLDVIRKFVNLVTPFLQHWSSCLPDYSIKWARTAELIEHLDFYDIVDFDYTVGGKRVNPKDLYSDGPVRALKQLAGLTRMSRVMDSYSADSVRSLAEHDFGSRPDELWIVNSERMTRHHAEQLSDVAKQLFLEDIVLATELVMEQRATLNYVVDWVRGTRATYLDQLTSDSAAAHRHDTMRLLLARIAWTTDIYGESISVERDSSSSFFRNAMSKVSEAKEIEPYRQQVNRSVESLLNVSSAVFGERTAAASSDLQMVGLNLSRSSRNVGIAAVVLAIAAAILAGIQIWVAVAPPNPGAGQGQTKPISTSLQVTGTPTTSVSIRLPSPTSP